MFKLIKKWFNNLTDDHTWRFVSERPIPVKVGIDNHTWRFKSISVNKPR